MLPIDLAAYQDEIRMRVRAHDSADQILEELTLIEAEKTFARDGRAAIPLSPSLAHDVEGLVLEARFWIERIERPEITIEIPATDQGLVAYRTIIEHGRPADITAIFSVDRLEEAIYAYV